jgi:hypothetical protein
VCQKKHADGKDEHEWADEQPDVQVKISDEPVKTPSHSTGDLSEFENLARSPPWKNLA